jgi:hypothetical protein
MLLLSHNTTHHTTPVQVDLGEDICIFGENLFVSLTNEIERVSESEEGREWQVLVSRPAAAANRKCNSSSSKGVWAQRERACKA